MDLKKIGILTYYHNSTNYGGNLQAYALCRKLNQLGYDAEQICFDANAKNKPGSIAEKLKHLLRGMKRKAVNLFQRKNEKKNRQLLKERRAAFAYFARELIPHSERVYNAQTIIEANELYDCFVAGSDQIWNLDWYVPTYFLDFVNQQKTKVSYAASFGISQFSAEQKEIIKQHLKDYKMLSLRESSPLETEGVFPFEVKVLADPTLLLTAEDWSQIASPAVTGKKYMFCYFFGNNQESRKLANEYAKINGLKIFTIPHLNGENSLDVRFGNFQMEACTPETFLSLIKHAECIFTDSFHAVVFSYLFKKQFFVFKRSQKDSMSSRISSITELFGAKDRFFCEEKRMSIEHIQGVADLNYDVENDRLSKLIHESEAFLANIKNI